jgi:holliday junction DNA helicase RuvA
MISFLNGLIINKGNGFVIMVVNDVGYKVFVSQPLWDAMSIGQNAEFYTFQYVREDSLDLYGFKNIEELEIFEMLLSISGIGPKTALGVMAVGSTAEIRDSIARGDSNFLTKVSGIGRKTADRVILELRDKIQSIASGSLGNESPTSSTSGDEIDAMMALGYSMLEAREALRSVDPAIKESGARIREALKVLGKR